MSDTFLHSPDALSPVDITPYQSGNTGVDYVTTFDSGEPGYHVVISALIHGNELCGARVLDHLLQNDLRPVSGKLTFIFANPEAYSRFDPSAPFDSRFVDEDLNRVWGLDVLESAYESLEINRARDLRPFLDQADALLDIHSMHDPAPPLLLAGPHAKGLQLAKDLATPEIVICDHGHAAGTRMRDYGGFGDPMSAQNALLLEAGQHWETTSEQVARDITLRFLKLFGIIDIETLMDDHLPLALDQALIEVTGQITAQTNGFQFADTFSGLVCIEKAGTVFAQDGEITISTPYDDCLLIMPDMSPAKGQTAVRLGRQFN